METEIIKPESQVKLVGLTGRYRDCIYLIHAGEFLIGRSPECHLILEESTVSGKHARIVRCGDHYELQDLRSTNGTYVEGVKIDVKKLRSEDRLRFDRYEFRFINPLDVSRTVVGEAPRLDAVQKTALREADAPRGPAFSSPHLPPEPPLPPRPHGQAARPSHPLEDTHPPGRSGRASPGSAGRALGGWLLGILIAYLLGVIPMAAVTFARSALTLDDLPQLIRGVVHLHPGMHLHPAWIHADLKDAPVILVGLFLLLGIILGGLITQNARRRGRFASAFLLALGYVLLSLLLQAAGSDFNFAGLPQSYPQFFQFLGAWGNFALGVAYFFAVSLVLGWLGALLGRRER